MISRIHVDASSQPASTQVAEKDFFVDFQGFCPLFRNTYFNEHFLMAALV